jgi:hypothetical protein
MAEWRCAPGAATGRHRHEHDVIKANAFEYAFIEIELK